MAVGTPWAIDGTTIPGKELRQFLQSLLGGTVGAFAGGVSASDRTHGVAGPADLLVTQKGTPNMSVDVASGSAFVHGTEAATQGVMWGYNDATTNLVIAAADATNPRRDLVVLQMRDDDYSGAFRDARLFIVQGTPAASPADPTPPANSLVLARVAVAALATSITNANITDLRRRVAGVGGEIVCTSATRPTTGLYPGMRIFETDTFRHLVYQSATTLWTPEWNMPWGLVGQATNIGTATSGVTVNAITSAVNFTAVANRKYITRLTGTHIGSVLGDIYTIDVREATIAGAISYGLAERLTIAIATGQQTFHVASDPTTQTAGAHTALGCAARIQGTGTLTTGTVGSTIMTIEDVGPSANPA